MESGGTSATSTKPRISLHYIRATSLRSTRMELMLHHAESIRAVSSSKCKKHSVMLGTLYHSRNENPKPNVFW